MKVERFFSLQNAQNIGFAHLVAVLAVCLLLWSQCIVGQQAPVPKMTLSQVEELVAAKVPDATLQVQIQKRGLTPAPTPALIESLRATGAGPLTLAAVKAALHSSSQTAASTKLPARTQTIPGPAGTKPHAPVNVMIDSNIAEGLLLHKTYPSLNFMKAASAMRLSGTVELKITVSATGRVEGAEAISGPPFLRVAAVETVKNWLYKPFTLNRAPVKFETTVSVPFTPDSTNSTQSPATQPASQPDQVSNSETWVDPATHLMWEKQDNGSDVNWQQAADYCQALQTANYSDWRMPTIEELKSIYDSSLDVPGKCCGGGSITWHVKGNLVLTGGPWASTQISPAVAWFLNFNQGKPTTVLTNHTNGWRALCVRGNGAPSSETAANWVNENQRAFNKSQHSPDDAQANSEVWKDPRTHLMWTQEDSAQKMNWKDAVEYYRTMQRGGYSDWGLPTLNELQEISTSEKWTMKSFHFIGAFRMKSTNQWCSNQGKAWLFYAIDNTNSKVSDAILPYYDGANAMCVRKSLDH